MGPRSSGLTAPNALQAYLISRREGALRGGGPPRAGRSGEKKVDAIDATGNSRSLQPTPLQATLAHRECVQIEGFQAHRHPDTIGSQKYLASVRHAGALAWWI